ncbi:MAG TPA: DUF4139 domain-containing protein [Planctomycetota bacterium]|nr:DUF4139 domain-containing protein [Planctomycetota bacterium]
MRYLLAAVILTQLLRAEEPEIKSRIVSVGLFKNGLAVIRCEAELPKPGTYLITDVPDPVHGTWSIGADVPIEARVAERELLEAVHASEGMSMQESLAGRTVTIHFRDGQIPAATGKVEAVPEKDDHADEVAARGRHAGMAYVAPPQRFLVLSTEAGRIFVDPGMIAYLKAEGKDETKQKVRKPVLLLTAKGEGDKPLKINLSYLARGIGWAPSYRVDLSDPKTLTIEQNAVVRNELADLENTSVDLVSGFPSIQFGHVTSLLSSQPNWNNFTEQLRRNEQSDENAMGQVMLQSNDYQIRNARPGFELGAALPGDGVDIHYQPLGARNLKKGETLGTSIAKERAEYERLVEWVIPDTRNEYGSYVNRGWGAAQNPNGDPWDVVRFRNPFKFPMTTAPATTVSGERFLGQRMSAWVNPGEETCLQITKALSIRALSTEREEAGKREELWVGGHRYYRATVSGELKMTNFRKEEVKMIVRRQFSGELTAADGAPKKTLREEGVFSVNPRNELNWTLNLKPGEQKTLTYSYTVLVSN